MINLENILIIDDNKSRWKSISSEFPKHVVSGDKLKDFFEFDAAGQYCEPKFDPNIYRFVFIHHSQKGDSMIPSNLLDRIKQVLSLKLVLFSGSIEERIVNDDDPERVFRSLSRDKLSQKLRLFIKTSIMLDRWEINGLFYDYPKRLKSQLVIALYDGTELSELLTSTEMEEFLKVVCVKMGSNDHHKIISSTKDNFSENLEALLI